MHDIGAGTLKL